MCSLVTDDHLPEWPFFFVIAKRFNDLVERKRAINYRFQAVYSDGAVHGSELGPIAGENDAERRDRVVEQVNVDF